MVTIQSGSSPGSRVEAGDSVLAAAKSVSIKPVQKRFAAFQKAHLAYRAADDKARKATESLRAQQARVGEIDVDQDADVMALAVVLPTDGLPRQNPFKPFGVPAPSIVCGMGYADEAEVVLKLEKAVLKRAGLSNASRAAAKKAGQTAKKVKAALAIIPKLEKARADAVSARDALAQGWETAFAALKRAARAAEDDGAKGVHAALFERAPKPKAKKKNAKKPQANDGAAKAKPETSNGADAAKSKASDGADAKPTASDGAGSAGAKPTASNGAGSAEAKPA